MTPDDLRAFRKAHKLTQRQLAELLPVSFYTLRGWEQGAWPAPTFLPAALKWVESRFPTQPFTEGHMEPVVGTFIIERPDGSSKVIAEYAGVPEIKAVKS